MTTGDIPAGRIGNYKCPFCDVTAKAERDMIEHRKESTPCREANDVRRGMTVKDMWDDLLGEVTASTQPPTP